MVWLHRSKQSLLALVFHEDNVYKSFSLQTSKRAYEHSGFILRLILENNEIKYEPDFKDYEVVLLNVYDVMLKAIAVVPRVEMKLYSEWVSWANCKL